MILKKLTFVSGTDSNYFPLLVELIHSIRRFEQGRAIDICIIDGGMTADQLEQLRPLVTKIIAPDWPSPQIATKAKGKNYLKSCVCRPFIPDIFPDYEHYIWLDCDTWIQDWSAIEMAISALLQKPNSMILTNGVDRFSGKNLRIKWFWRWPYKIRSFYFSNAVNAFGFKTAKNLLNYYTLYAGFFALSRHAPHWKRWQELAVIAAEKGKVFTAEQLSLGILVYIDSYKAEILPAYTHWVCNKTPLYDTDKKIFVEPYTPMQTLGILHLSGVDDIRADRNVTIPVPTQDGNTVQLNYRYPHHNGGEVMTGAPKRK